MAIMQLQRDHGVSPLGGCLPILLQMPIWVSLYSMLGNAVELYRVRLWWIADMTASDHYFVLPLLTGVLMFLQTKQSAKTTPVDPQMKMVDVYKRQAVSGRADRLRGQVVIAHVVLRPNRCV